MKKVITITIETTDELPTGFTSWTDYLHYHSIIYLGEDETEVEFETQKVVEGFCLQRDEDNKAKAFTLLEDITRSFEEVDFLKAVNGEVK